MGNEAGKGNTEGEESLKHLQTPHLSSDQPWLAYPILAKQEQQQARERRCGSCRAVPSVAVTRSAKTHQMMFCPLSSICNLIFPNSPNCPPLPLTRKIGGKLQQLIFLLQSLGSDKCDIQQKVGQVNLILSRACLHQTGGLLSSLASGSQTQSTNFPSRCLAGFKGSVLSSLPGGVEQERERAGAATDSLFVGEFL